MRALKRLRIPTLVFVNKIDRPGAGDERIVHEIAERLTPTVVPMGTAHALGTPRPRPFTVSSIDDPAVRARLAEVLAARDEGIMGGVRRRRISCADSRASRRTREPDEAGARASCLLRVRGHGRGRRVVADRPSPSCCPQPQAIPTARASGTVFKIERGTSGEKIAYVRLFSGTIHTRERLRFGNGLDGKVTAIAVFEHGPAVQRPAVSAGAVAKLWGLAGVSGR